MNQLKTVLKAIAVDSKKAADDAFAVMDDNDDNNDNGNVTFTIEDNQAKENATVCPCHEDDEHIWREQKEKLTVCSIRCKNTSPILQHNKSWINWNLYILFIYNVHSRTKERYIFSRIAKQSRLMD